MDIHDWKGRPRVVVTGMAVLSPLGNTVDSFWRGLVEGRSGIARLSLFDPSGYPCQIGGEVKEFKPEDHMPAKEAKRMARFSQFAVAGARMAIESARLDLSKVDRTRAGVVLGNGNGGFPSIDEGMRVLVAKGGQRLSPFFFPMILPNMAAAQVSIRFGLGGYNSTVVTACAAGTQGIGEAVEIIRRGGADLMVTGGVEGGVSELGLAGFCAMKALSTRNDDPAKASRPFDARRDGFVPADGAGLLVVERLDHALQRAAPVLAEIVGYGVTADAFHIVHPDDAGDGAARAMALALHDAHLTVDEVDYINAHGTSTPVNDATETRAIKRIFGERAYKVPISSTKSMVGHALGGAGGMEAVATIKTIQEGVVHPTINYEFPDPVCDLDYVPNQARRVPVRVAMSNSFGFGGQNACLVFRAFTDGRLP